MNIWTKRCLEAGVIVGGLWVLGSGLASAQDLNHGTAGSTSHRAHSVLSAPITAPVTVSGNAISVLDGRHASTAGSSSGTASTPAAPPARHRSLVSAPVTAPVTVCGNAVGHASASCGATGSGSSSSSGAVIDTPVSAPVTVCGNGAGLLGKASASCTGTSTGSTGSSGGTSTGSSSGGVSVPVSAPVTACGNGVGLLGSASASCSGSNPPVTGGGTGTQSQGGASQAADSIAAQDPVAPGLAGHAAAARALAFTGSSLALLEWLAVTLLVAGFALTFGWHSRTS